MLATANAITALLADEFVDVPFELPAHGDIGNEECVQFHYERRNGRFVECLVAPSGVYLIAHVNGAPGAVNRCRASLPVDIAYQITAMS
jgi:hypothetical protein